MSDEEHESWNTRQRPVSHVTNGLCDFALDFTEACSLFIEFVMPKQRILVDGKGVLISSFPLTLLIYFQFFNTLLRALHQMYDVWSVLQTSMDSPVLWRDSIFLAMQEQTCIGST